MTKLVSARFISSRFINTVIASCAAVVLLLFLLSYSETGSLPIIDQDNLQNTQPDFYLGKTYSSHFDQQGHLDFTINSEHVEHNPKNGSIKMIDPLFNIYDEGTLAWVIRSQTAVVNNDNQKVELQQHVIITSSDNATVLKTTQLFIFPNKKLAKTDQPVTLQNPNGFTSSVGLTADLQGKKIDLLSQVRGQYQGVLFDEKD